MTDIGFQLSSIYMIYELCLYMYLVVVGEDE